MAGLLDGLNNQDLMQLIELQRQLGQSPFAQNMPYQYPKDNPPKAPPAVNLPFIQGGPNPTPIPELQLLASRGGPQDPNYNWLQPPPLQQQPKTPPPSPPPQAQAPAIRPDTATPLPPMPQRNPRFKTIQEAIRDASVDNPILEEATRLGHSPPMYSPQEFFTDKKRKSRKAI